ncbi:MAG: zinc-dependent metalloprotease, partial [Chitinophagaceae bacterium]
LLSVERLNRMQLSVDRFGEAKSYGALEMLNDLQTGLFSELKTNKAIDPYRRLLQRGYTDRLVALISNEGFAVQVLTIGLGGASLNSTDTKKTDLPSIARAQLVKLRSTVNAASVTATDTMSKIHLQDLAEKIKRALDPK